MEMWFSEMHTPNVKISIRIDRQLYSGQSDYQRIDVFDSTELGRFVIWFFHFCLGRRWIVE